MNEVLISITPYISRSIRFSDVKAVTAGEKIAVFVDSASEYWSVDLVLNSGGKAEIYAARDVRKSQDVAIRVRAFIGVEQADLNIGDTYRDKHMLGYGQDSMSRRRRF